MKKIIGLIICLCILFTGAVSIEVFAADQVVMTVEYVKDGEVITDEWTVFYEGWTDAIQKSMSKDHYSVKVTLMADWYSDDDGQFTPDFFNDDGFNWDAIDFPKGCNILLDLNGHKIDRKLEEWEYNGEVMYVNEGASVIIRNGTISGGFSCNGAGGIHMSGGSLTLNDVNITNNKVEDDDGAGIAVYGGTLKMIGGSISNNNAYASSSNVFGGGLHAHNGTIELRNVTIADNGVYGAGETCCGAAIYLRDADLKLENCTIKNNHSAGNGGAIFVYGGNLLMDRSTVTGNYGGHHAGGIYIAGGKSKFINSDIYDNTSAWNGHAVFVHQNSGNAEFDGCYVEGDVVDSFNRIVWKNTRENMNKLMGSIINEGENGFAAVAVSAVVAVAVIGLISIIVIRKKSKNN